MEILHSGVFTHIITHDVTAVERSTKTNANSRAIFAIMEMMKSNVKILKIAETSIVMVKQWKGIAP